MLKRSSIVVAFVSVVSFIAAVSCGRKESPKKPDANGQNHGPSGLIEPEQIYCPEFYKYDVESHMCYGKQGVLGPFNKTMVSLCESYGGGSACNNLHWDRDFAMQIRGKELCPVGTQWESQLLVCSDDEHVYGPFLKTQYQSCIDARGGAACETMRWSRSFFVSMVGGTPPKAPIQPDEPTQGGSKSAFNLREPSDSEIQDVRSFWATYYKVPTVRDVGSSGYPLLDMSGRSLGVALKAEDWCHASLEGTVRVLSSNGYATVFNYVGSHQERKQVDCSPWISLPGLGYSRFYKAKGEFGDGVRGYILQPYRTIAVDPGWMPYGTLVYVPSARGTKLTMPDGSEEVHDGYFFAADTGGALHGNHVDVFIGTATTTPFGFVRSTASATYKMYVVNNPKIRSMMIDRHTK